MSQVLVIFVILTQQMTFVIKPYDLDYCPSYEEAKANMSHLYQEYDVGYWSYQCFNRGSNV
jgi:hypothetical protein